MSQDRNNYSSFHLGILKADPDLMKLFTVHEHKLLCLLADPLAEIGNLKSIQEFNINPIVNLSRSHEVCSVSLRNLQILEKSSVFDQTQKYIDFKEDVKFSTIIAMDLDYHRSKITNALSNENINHRVVKGHSFASDLYPKMSDRLYTDVDIVVSENKIQRARDIVSSLNYKPIKKTFWDNSEKNMEFKFSFENNPHVLIELHTDLVHMPALRKAKRLNYKNLELAYCSDEKPMAGHFILAVAHASLGHKFHNLKLIVDILQAIRALSKDDVKYLANTVRTLNFKREANICLKLCMELFPDPAVKNKCEVVANAIGIGKTQNLVRGIDVIKAPLKNNFASKWRRRAFRIYQIYKT
jgi:hypothetical protein